MPTDFDPKQLLAAGDTSLGIEFGSTRIKACLVAPDATPIATGVHEWENQLVDGHWSYSLKSIWSGVQAAYTSLIKQCEEKYAFKPTSYASIGVSAMMHGYLAFDANDELLVPFRTWRDTTTGPAAEQLTKVFKVNIPLRWSVAHYYQAMLDQEPHIENVSFLTTLAGYVHWKLTGEKVLGVGDASGMFPLNSDGTEYRADLIEIFNKMSTSERDIKELLPAIRTAGQSGGKLTEAGAKLLDPTGKLEAGILFAPPEGDAGTGMVATNAVKPRTGNVSVGTSIFLMAVLENPLKHLHPEIDLVTTPDGHPVAMVHCNNGADELARWVDMFREVAQLLNAPDTSADAVYAATLGAALEGEADAGGVFAFNNLAGEPVTHLDGGRPLITRSPWATLNLPNFMRAQVCSTFAALAIGLEVLETEAVQLDVLSAHGGVFRTEKVAQRLLAAATHTPITVQDSASEGGAWGMAVLAAYSAYSQNVASPQPLDEYLTDTVFASAAQETIAPSAADERGFATFLAGYRQALTIQPHAIRALPPRAL
ncbi:xylulokinase [Gleimia hominis]|uniref:xylulokinase n=1 Tax=Gleimia hominis TaxID=595468 RepID=UPI000C7FCCBF|nr:FGGY-family carbohydrate kinase [Gleimia hominis]WIK64675.1 FGGY-family carbohydrate kinase [Gleimia hominis]